MQTDLQELFAATVTLILAHSYVLEDESAMLTHWYTPVSSAGVISSVGVMWTARSLAEG